MHFPCPTDVAPAFLAQGTPVASHVRNPTTLYIMVNDHDEGAELRVLVVDDHMDATTTLTTLLRLLRCRAAYAFGPEMALRIAPLFKPELVFLDLDMPGADGCEVLAAMRDTNEGLRDALYICLTGRSEPEDRRRCEEAGFHRFVSKPMEPDQLQDILKEALARRTEGFPGHGRAAAANQSELHAARRQQGAE